MPAGLAAIFWVWVGFLCVCNITFSYVATNKAMPPRTADKNSRQEQPTRTAANNSRQQQHQLLDKKNTATICCSYQFRVAQT
jgi:hypothetical protein